MLCFHYCPLQLSSCSATRVIAFHFLFVSQEFEFLEQFYMARAYMKALTPLNTRHFQAKTTT